MMVERAFGDLCRAGDVSRRDTAKALRGKQALGRDDELFLLVERRGTGGDAGCSRSCHAGRAGNFGVRIERTLTNYERALNTMSSGPRLISEAAGPGCTAAWVRGPAPGRPEPAGPPGPGY